MSDPLASGDSILSPQIKTRSGHVAGISEAADGHAAAKRHRAPTPPANRTNQANDPNQGQGFSDRGILTFVSHIQGPYAAHEHIFRQIALDEINNIAADVRNQILADLYPDGNFVEAGVITADNFRLCCQYMLKAETIFDANSAKNWGFISSINNYQNLFNMSKLKKFYLTLSVFR